MDVSIVTSSTQLVVLRCDMVPVQRSRIVNVRRILYKPGPREGGISNKGNGSAREKISYIIEDLWKS